MKNLYLHKKLPEETWKRTMIRVVNKSRGRLNERQEKYEGSPITHKKSGDYLSWWSKSWNIVMGSRICRCNMKANQQIIRIEDKLTKSEKLILWCEVVPAYSHSNKPTLQVYVGRKFIQKQLLSWQILNYIW